MFLRIYGLIILFFIGWTVSAQLQPTWEWQRNYGGSMDERSHAMELTDDGNIIVVGNSASNDGDVGKNQGGADLWVLYLEDSNAVIWERSFGGSGDETAFDVRQTDDGGYIVVGSTTSTDGDVDYNHGGADAWLIKLDTLGHIEWEQTYGGTGEDIAYAVQQTDDGGYVVAGETHSKDGDVDPHPLNGNLWVFKTDDKGNLLWEYSYGGTGDETSRGIKQTADGGYIVAGHTSSTDGDVSVNHGGYDIWVLKLMSDGQLDWEKSFGGDRDDFASDTHYYATGNDCIRQTPDDGFVLAGTTSSDVGGRTQDLRSSNVWVIRLTSQGNIIWDYAYGGTSFEVAASVYPTPDGNFIVSGVAISKDGDLASDPPLEVEANTWVFKLNSSGGLLWSHTYGVASGSSDLALQGCEIIVSGFHHGPPAFDVEQSQGMIDVWVIKLKFEPDLPTAASPQRFCASSQPTIADLEASGKHLTWYENDSSKVVLADTVSLQDGKTYYVSQTVDGCEGKTLAVEVEVIGQSPPTLTTDMADPICLGAEVVYHTDEGYSDYTWQISGGDILDGGGKTDDFVRVLWQETENTTVDIAYDLGDHCGMSQTTRYHEDVGLCDIAIDKSVNETTPKFNSEVVFTVTATNLGGHDFRDVVIEENIPSGFKLLDYNASLGIYNPQSGLWKISLFPGEQTATLKLNVQVLKQGDYQNIASLASSAPTDSNPSNNTARAGVQPEAFCTINPPEGFSPNGDGYNEVFKIECIEDYPNNEVKIFNRYGTLVYQVSNYNNEERVFEGNSENGKRLPSGTYYYIIKTNQDSYTGWVYLQR